MRVPREFPLLQIAEETSYLEQQAECHTEDQFRRLAILDYHDSTRPESYPDPVTHTTRSVAAVLADIDRASVERLVLMRAVNSSNEGPEIRAARSARFAAQRKVECEAIKAALRPQVASRYQPPEYSSPCIARDAYPFLQAGPSNPPSHWQRPHLLPNTIPVPTQSTPNPFAYPTTIDTSLRTHPMETNYPAELHQADLYLFQDLANSLPPIHSPTQTPYANPSTLPSIPRRMSTSSTQSTTPTPAPAKTLLIKHRVRRNSDPNAPRRKRGRPLGSKNRVIATGEYEGRGSAMGGLAPEVLSEEGGGRCVVVMDGDEYVWLG